MKKGTQYRKLATNPVGLGRGLVIKDVDCEDGIFIVPELHEIQKRKLKSALRVGLIREVNVKDEAKKVANTADASMVKIQEDYDTLNLQLQQALSTIKELQKGSDDAWMTMSIDELKDAYTIPELKAFCEELEVEFKSNSKETSLANKIVEALKDDEGSED